MIPFRDDQPIGRIPYLTWALIVINMVVFISYWPLFEKPPELRQFFLTWGAIPADVTAGSAYQGLVTSMFLHADVLHLLGNMVFLFIFGDNLEDEMGAMGFLFFYLATGVLAGLIQVAAEPESTIPMVGVG